MCLINSLYSLIHKTYLIPDNFATIEILAFLMDDKNGQNLKVPNFPNEIIIL